MNTHNISGLLSEYGGYPESWDIEDESDLSAEDRPCCTGTNDKSEPLDTAGDHQESRQATNGKLKNFIAGPIDLLWLKRAISIRRPAADVAIPLWFKVGVTKDKFLQNGLRHSRAIKVDKGLRKKFDINQHTMSRGLKILKKAGLIEKIVSGRGRCPVIVINNLSAMGADDVRK